jgi:signal transduction histidine kinase
VLGVKTDVTEKRKIEVQFIRAQRMASLGLLAGGIAHDLNNVLTPIMLSIDVLKNLVKDKPEAQDVVETIELSTRRGSDIVQQVLSFARGMEGQRIVIQPKYLLQEIEYIIKDTFPKEIRLQFALPQDTWTIIGDPTQIQQVLLNLCVNARDAMPNGGTLTISAENVNLDQHYAGLNPDAHPGAHVLLQITDTGTGMPPGIIEKIFDPFFTTKEIGKGTGLGLSTSLAIVKSHGSTASQGKARPSRLTSPGRPRPRTKRRSKSLPNCPAATVNSSSSSMMKPPCARLRGRRWKLSATAFPWPAMALKLSPRSHARARRSPWFSRT